MKHLLTLLCMAITSIYANADYVNYFRQGTIWEETIWPDEPWPIGISLTYEIDGIKEIDGKTAMVLWCTKKNDPETKHQISYLLCDGEKVLFTDETAKQWWILYDFGLGADEVLGVASPYESRHIYIGLHDVIRLNTISLTSSTGNYEAFRVLDKENYDWRVEGNHTHRISDFDSGEWIKGIGSTNGLLQNYFYGMVGGGHTLDRVISDGEVVYDRTGLKLYTYENCFNQVGSTWEQTNVSGYPGMEGEDLDTFTTKNEVAFLGRPAVDVWYKNSDNPMDESLYGYFHCEGAKVYFAKPDSEDWNLLYDFDLPLDGVAEVVSPVMQDWANNPYEMICISHEDFQTERENLKMMKVTNKRWWDEFTTTEDDHGLWVPGIGSLIGLFRNVQYGWCGDSYSYISKVTSNGRIVYQNSSIGLNGIESVPITNGEDIYYDLSGRKVDPKYADGLIIKIDSEGKPHKYITKYMNSSETSY